MFVATFGANAIVTSWLTRSGFSPWLHGFDLYKVWGVAFVYFYFEVPLMVLIITPALNGLRPAWREAAQNLGASTWRYWRHVGIPVPPPSVLGSTFLLFGSGLSAYATTEEHPAGGTVAITPIQIGPYLQGNAISGEEHIGYALGFGMRNPLLLNPRPRLRLLAGKVVEMASVVTDNIVDFELPMVPLDLTKRCRIRSACGLSYLVLLLCDLHHLRFDAALKFDCKHQRGLPVFVDHGHSEGILVWARRSFSP